MIFHMTGMLELGQRTAAATPSGLSTSLYVEGIDARMRRRDLMFRSTPKCCAYVEMSNVILCSP